MLFFFFFFGFGLTAMSLNTSTDMQKSGESVDSDWFTKYDALFKKYGSRNGVPWTWLKGIAFNESDLGRDPRVVQRTWSSDGKSRGIMQLTIPTAQDFVPDISPNDLDDPETSIDIASQYLGFLFDRYGGDAQKVIMSYNQGQGNTDKGKTYALGYFERWQKNMAMIGEN